MEESQPPPLESSPLALIRTVQADLADLETSLNVLFPQSTDPPSPDPSLTTSLASSKKSLEDAPISLVRRVK